MYDLLVHLIKHVFDSSSLSWWAKSGIRTKYNDAVNSRQSKRWSFMTILYICVCYCYKRSGYAVLTSIYARCAASDYCFLCTSARLSTQHCNVILSHISQLVSAFYVCVLKCVRPFWLAVCREFPDDLCYRCSTYWAPMPTISIQILTMLLYRGEWYSRPACVFQITTSTAVSLF